MMTSSGSLGPSFPISGRDLRYLGIYPGEQHRKLLQTLEATIPPPRISTTPCLAPEEVVRVLVILIRVDHMMEALLLGTEFLQLRQEFRPGYPIARCTN